MSYHLRLAPVLTGLFVLFIHLLCFKSPIVAQPQPEPAAPDIHIDWFGEANGVSLGRTNEILKDRQGFMWFGTFTGLYKYDGYEFTIFTPNPEDSTSISDTWIDALFEDSEGVLWVGTVRGGLNRFNPETQTFTRFQHNPEDPQSISPGQIRAIYEDQSGTFWVGTLSGLNRMDRRQETFELFNHDPEDPNTISDNNIRSINEDRSGNLWVGTGEGGDFGGLNRLDTTRTIVTRYLHNPEDPETLIDNRVSAIFEDHAGTLWVGTYRGGLHKYDPQKDSFTRYLLNYDDPNSLKTPFAGRVDTTYDYRGINAIYEARNLPGVLWISTARFGLVRYDSRDGSFVQYEDDPSIEPSLVNADTWDIYEDEKGTLWIGSRDAGVHKVNPIGSPIRVHTLKNSLKAHHVWDVWVDSTGIIWTQTNSGDDRLDPSTGSIQSLPRYRSLFQNIQDESIEAELSAYLLEHGVSIHLNDSRDNLWIGTQRGGLIQVNPKNEEYTLHTFIPEHESGLLSNNIRDLFEDREHRLWIQTSGGLQLYDPLENSFTAFEHIKRGKIRTEDAHGNLWLSGGTWGISRFNPEKKTYDSYLDEVYLTDFLELPNNQFLAGTLRQGLFLFEPEAEIIKTFTVKDGLPVNGINGLIKDAHGKVWVTASNHLLSFDPQLELFKNRPLPYSFRGQSFLASPFQDQNGRLYFPSQRLVLEYSPTKIIQDTLPPPVVLTEFNLSNKAVPITQEGPLQTHISLAKDITLPFDQNDFSFEYAALAYERPDLNRYSYQLEGYDSDWQDGSISRTATYTNLSPGNYTFRVKAANASGVWNEAGTSIDITILPPWWQTTWAYLSYGLLFLLSFFGISQGQRQRVLRKERERTMQRELEQAKEIEKAYGQLEEAHSHLKTTQAQLIQSEKMASLGQLTAGIAHEIKNPLNFVNNFSRLSVDVLDELQEWVEEEGGMKIPDVKELMDTLKLNATKIHQHGKRADLIVRSMMEHASGATGEKRPVDLNQFVDEYINLALQAKQSQHPDFDVEVNRLYGFNGTVDLIPQEIGRVIINLINNAFDALLDENVQQQGKHKACLDVSTGQQNGFAEIRVADNGTGIADEVIDKIFNPFFTTKPTGSGTGLGLSLSYDIVTQGHGGNFKAESKKGNGTSFIVQLPI